MMKPAKQSIKPALHTLIQGGQPALDDKVSALHNSQEETTGGKLAQQVNDELHHPLGIHDGICDEDEQHRNGGGAFSTSTNVSLGQADRVQTFIVLRKFRETVEKVLQKPWNERHVQS